MNDKTILEDHKNQKETPLEEPRKHTRKNSFNESQLRKENDISATSLFFAVFIVFFFICISVLILSLFVLYRAISQSGLVFDGETFQYVVGEASKKTKNTYLDWAINHP